VVGAAAEELVPQDRAAMATTWVADLPMIGNAPERTSALRASEVLLCRYFLEAIAAP
jgi:hypothetical protein